MGTETGIQGGAVTAVLVREVELVVLAASEDGLDCSVEAEEEEGMGALYRI